jgi:hypothetical protein
MVERRRLNWSTPQATNEITEKVLPNLTAEDLKDLGVRLKLRSQTTMSMTAPIIWGGAHHPPGKRGCPGQFELGVRGSQKTPTACGRFHGGKSTGPKTQTGRARHDGPHEGPHWLAAGLSRQPKLN